LDDSPFLGTWDARSMRIDLLEADDRIGGGRIYPLKGKSPREGAA
jgi:hypothetical protein